MSQTMGAFRLGLMVSLAVVFAGCPPPPKTVEVFGHVYDLDTAPLTTIAGATVVVEGVGQVTSDSEGYYAVDVPPGSAVFAVTASGYKPFVLTFNIPDVPRYAVDLWLEQI